jgi:hypothetical protein
VTRRTPQPHTCTTSWIASSSVSDVAWMARYRDALEKRRRERTGSSTVADLRTRSGDLTHRVSHRGHRATPNAGPGSQRNPGRQDRDSGVTASP